jgi:membrane protease YdiL (CAAX protease family)
LLVLVTGGRQGWGRLLARITRWRAGLVWYAAALLLVPGLNALSYLGYGLLQGEFYAISYTALAFGIPAGILSSLLEEFGWRGFVLPVLQTRYSAFVASLIVGLGWGLWHLRLNVIMMGQYGALAIPLLLLSAPVGLTAISVLMTWVHNNSGGSLLLMILFHLSLTSSNFVFGPPPTTGGAELLRFYLISAVVQWSAVAVVVMMAGAHRLVQEERRRLNAALLPAGATREKRTEP